MGHGEMAEVRDTPLQQTIGHERKLTKDIRVPAGASHDDDDDFFFFCVHGRGQTDDGG
jgi:hypothetical protein